MHFSAFKITYALVAYLYAFTLFSDSEKDDALYMIIRLHLSFQKWKPFSSVKTRNLGFS